MVGWATHQAALKTVQRAQRNVTRYGRVKTGRMRREIRIIRTIRTNSEITVEISAEAPYSAFQMLGTRYIKPAPFLKDAIDELKANDFQPK